LNIPVIITSINKSTEAVKYFDCHEGCNLFLVGDKKTPADVEISGSFLSVDDQGKLPFQLGELLPFNHYCRKNLGYLVAINSGYEVIFETDDDNIPYDHWFDTLQDLMTSQPEFCIGGSEETFVNPYSVFCQDLVWPRGFPLQMVTKRSSISKGPEARQIKVWQGLADLDPDVDAVYRLVLNKSIKFGDGRISISKSTFAPFNSQNTLWKKEAFFAMYLPFTVTFRFTDILRSYVAKRLLDQQDYALGFHEPTVFQERNEHDLMKDFNDELPMYQGCIDICRGLSQLDLAKFDKYDSLIECYRWLERHKYVGEADVLGVEAWVSDLKMILDD